MAILSINTNMMMHNANRSLASHYAADITAQNQGLRNANDAISLIQTADGALGVIDGKLIRMKELTELGIMEQDMENAVTWSRGSGA